MKHVERRKQVEAVQFTGENIDAVYEWESKMRSEFAGFSVASVLMRDQTERLLVYTKDGECYLNPGSYLVYDGDDFFPLSKEIFEERYEPA